MGRVVGSVVFLVASGCACPERSVWNNYLWIEVMQMPRDVVAAQVTVDGRRWQPLACAVTFDTEGDDPRIEGDTGDFGDIVTEDCDDAEQTGTYMTGWWTQFPHRGTPERIVLSLDWRTEAGVDGGFEEREVRPEWDFGLRDGLFCGTTTIGHVYIDPYGDEPIRF